TAGRQRRHPARRARGEPHARRARAVRARSDAARPGPAPHGPAALRRRPGGRRAARARRGGPLMFTGIVEEVGVITSAEERGGDLRIRVAARLVTEDLRVGDSVAVSGCCLTATTVAPGGFEADLSRETVAKTAPRWSEGARVNLERAMAAGDRFGGHMVSGHV